MEGSSLAFSAPLFEEHIAMQYTAGMRQKNSETDDMMTVEAGTRAEWRTWLAAHHDRTAGAWLIYHRKKTGNTGVDYEASVEEALCYGWIDSIIKKLDDEKYVRKFTPRRDGSVWSPSNKKRVEKLTEQGLMTEYGLEKVEAAKHSGAWDNPVRKPEFSNEIPSEFAEALGNYPVAKRTFQSLAPTYRKQYLLWIGSAKRPETRKNRIRESIRLLAEGKKLGLK